MSDNCALNAIGLPETGGTITNELGEEQAFEIEVEFRNGDVLIDRTSGYTEKLAPGDTAQWSVSSLETADAVTDCKTAVSLSIIGG